MPTLSKRWHLAAPLTPEADTALSRFHPITRQILFNRGLSNATEADRFLRAAPPDVTDPFLLTGMETAVERILYALQHNQPIAVYGDYDADGVTATALMVQTLTALGGNVRAYIPNRFDEGYGLNNDALTTLQNNGFQLVISVDCGIRSLEEAAHAQKIGLDLIITDHHTPGEQIPEALAVINPKLPGDPYPDKDLAGVGTAYKLASALVSRHPRPNFTLEEVHDLVALGTVADLVPLIGENRTLVRAGLRRLRAPQRQGILSLMGVASLTAPRVTAMDIGFALGPRLNAAGRLESALSAYELLTTRDVFRAGQIAQYLDNQNRERQKLTRDMQALAESLAIPDGEIPYLLFAAHPDFNAGVVGLAAARLTEQYYRPAIVAHQDAETTRGSCRSIAEFHITAALDQCKDLLLRHGGHAAAAGFTVPNENLPELIARLQAIAAEQLSGEDLRPIIYADAEVQLADLNMDLLKELDLLQPTGYGNPDPLFIARGVKVVNSRPVGRDASHLKLTLGDGKKVIDAIAFKFGHWQGNMPKQVDVAFSFERNEYQGYVSLQLNVRDLKATGEGW
ncbi:MAG: single-stranded-DNA-specific exonuclease RecJ [Anaerolineales bacterium]